MYGKLCIFIFAAWAGTSGQGAIAGLGICGVVLSATSQAASLMQVPTLSPVESTTPISRCDDPAILPSMCLSFCCCHLDCSTHVLTQVHIAGSRAHGSEVQRFSRANHHPTPSVCLFHGQAATHGSCHTRRTSGRATTHWRPPRRCSRCKSAARSWASYTRPPCTPSTTTPSRVRLRWSNRRLSAAGLAVITVRSVLCTLCPTGACTAW